MSSSGSSLVRQATAPAAKRRLDLALIRRRGESDHRDLGTGFEEQPGGLDAVHPRQPVVHQQDIGGMLAAERGRVVAVGGGGNDLETGLEAEQHLQRLAEDVVVLDDRHADGSAHSADSKSG